MRVRLLRGHPGRRRSPAASWLFHQPHRGLIRAGAALHGRTVAAKRSNFPVRVSFQTRWNAPALLAMPCQSPIHQMPYFPREAVVWSSGSKDAVVTRSGGPKRSLASRRDQQDFVHAAVRQGKDGDRDPARLVDGHVRLEVDRAVAGSRGHRLGPGPAPVAGCGHHDVRVRRSRLVGGKRDVQGIAPGRDRDRRAAVGPDAPGQGDRRRFGSQVDRRAEAESRVGRADGDDLAGQVAGRVLPRCPVADRAHQAVRSGGQLGARAYQRGGRGLASGSCAAARSSRRRR